MKNKKEQIGKSEDKKGRFFEGAVVLDAMDKTIVVQVTRTFRHPIIGKTVKVTKKYKAHDEQEIAKCGDWVEIEECRPLSKTKHMQLVRVVKS